MEGTLTARSGVSHSYMKGFSWFCEWSNRDRWVDEAKMVLNQQNAAWEEERTLGGRGMVTEARECCSACADRCSTTRRQLTVSRRVHQPAAWTLLRRRAGQSAVGHRSAQQASKRGA